MAAMSGGAVRVLLDGHERAADVGETLYQCALGMGVRLPTSCEQLGKCRECLVDVLDGEELLTAPASQEAWLTEGFRLACRTRVVASAGVVRCQSLRRGAMRIETDAGLLTSDRTLDPAVTRHGTRVFMDGVECGASEEAVHGLAIDVGTTTVALRLYNLETGALVATQSFENPQRFGGSDVMARIRYDGEHRGRLLRRTLLAYLAHAIEQLPVLSTSIWEIVVAGNSTMRDLFLGLDVQGIGVLPYRSATEVLLERGETTTTAVTVSARKFRLPVHRDARIVALPLVASHVGADAAAALLAVGLGRGDEVVALMDIGTNTEVLLGNRHRLLAASCPAGPAFEGGAIRAGMPALDGAIERVRLGGASVSCEVIGGGLPLGICGSGLVDALSELRRTGQLNEQGRFEDDRDFFLLDAASGIALHESDINELAQAKGANAAGIQILADVYGIPLDAITRLDLAGGFSRHLDVGAAQRIGLIPDLPTDRIRQVGNAALEGASIALLSRTAREELEYLVRRIEHVRLEAHPRFFDYFVEGCQLRPFGRDA